MPHFISNIYEKAYTPFTAKLAPRNLWSKPVLGKYTQPNHLSFRKKAIKG